MSSAASEKYRASSLEIQRESSLMSLVGSGGSAIDIGARDGHYTRLLMSRYREVVALDLHEPEIEGAVNVSGDVTGLSFPSGYFDLVLCAEVLEHVPDVAAAGREISRIAADRVVIGVPYRQDLRISRLTCQNCRKISAPYGHLHSFDEHTLRGLFSDLRLEHVEFVAQRRESTNNLAVWLMDCAGNPWGTYDQEEPCPYCGTSYRKPGARTTAQRSMAKLAHWLEEYETRRVQPCGRWIHALFRKK